MRIRLALVAVTAVAGLAWAQTAPESNEALINAPSSQAANRYLTPELLDTYAILPPAPVKGTTRYETDRKVFKATRKLEGSERWKLAQNDDDEKIILSDFACALGYQPTTDNAARLTALLAKTKQDVRYATNHPKNIYKRQRPYMIDKGNICVAKTEGLAKSPDYPSGHTTWGWTVGLILAELAPQQATDILIRARSYGESRVVCGVHNASAIEAGRTNASTIVAALHGSDQFRADLDAVRAEMAAARAAASGPAGGSPACAVEKALIAKTPY